jgi:hypothetical protein
MSARNQWEGEEEEEEEVETPLRGWLRRFAGLGGFA